MIHCRTLGPVELTGPGGAQVKLQGSKNLALLVYLARSPRHSRARDHLTGLLWGDKPEKDARHSLREALRILRRTLGEDGLDTDGDQIKLRSEALQLDTQRFEGFEAVRDWENATKLVSGEFLEGFRVRDASGFEDWVAAERLHWRRRAIVALASYTDELLSTGRTTDAVQVALRAHALDAGSQSATLAAMKSLALAGERTQALECYEAHLVRLSEVNAEPDVDVQRLAERVQKERRWQLPDTVPSGPDIGAESRRAPLVGREQELQRLTDAWAGTLGGEAGVGVIEGEQGCGKTRLGEELVSRARLDGAVVSTFRTVEADHDTPGAGILGLARDDLLDGSGLAAASRDALSTFASEIPEWADRFGSGDGTMPLGAALVDVTRALLENQPVLMMIDDAHWCDRESLLAIIAAVRDLAAMQFFVIFCVAPDPARPELDDLRARIGRDLRGVSVSLTALGDSALKALAAWAVPSYDQQQLERLTRRLAADSAGLPLLAVELLHAVALGLDLESVGGAWPQPLRTLSQTLPNDLPDAIVAAIRVGFRRLSQPAQQALAAAAIVDRTFTVDLLQRATQLDRQKLERALDELEWQRWVETDARGYSFIAGIVRDIVARDMLTGGQRKRILAAVQS